MSRSDDCFCTSRRDTLLGGLVGGSDHGWKDEGNPKPCCDVALSLKGFGGTRFLWRRRGGQRQQQCMRRDLRARSVCLYVCRFVCLFVCLSVYLYLCIVVGLSVCTMLQRGKRDKTLDVVMYVCLGVCMSSLIFVEVRSCGCMYVCMYAVVRVLCACRYVCICMHTCMYLYSMLREPCLSILEQ